MKQHSTPTVYLDNAATTAIDPAVAEAMMPFLTGLYGNPSSTHSHGRAVKAHLEQSRKKIAAAIGASPSEIYFTSGGTESDNTALRGYVHTYGLTHAITSPLEHHAVLHTLEALAAQGRIRLSLVRLHADGGIDMGHLEALLRDSPRTLVSLMHGNNEVGNLTDLKAVGATCRQYDAIFHTDTVQTMGYYPLNVQELGVHALVGSAHKFHGPKGVGFLYMRKDAKVSPFQTGGSQERGLRGGTENIMGIVGMARALELAFEQREAHEAHIRGLKAYMMERLREAIPGVSFNGQSADLAGSVYKVLSVRLPEGWGHEMLLFNLDLRGIAASGGSACSSGAQAGSHVLQAIHGSAAAGSVRFSFSKYNTKADVDAAVAALQEIGADASKQLA
jgi:cysteine desulfurase